MFCTKCGSKNKADATQCAQCGFPLKAAPQQSTRATDIKKTAAQSPFAKAGETLEASARTQAKPSMKGTMMGVAPPDMQAEIDKVKAARRVGAMTSPESPAAKPKPKPNPNPKPNPSMKGTMMGVAPPDMQAEIDKVKAARAAIANAPQATSAAAGSNRPKPNPSMKGTMMGVAPPDMQAEIDKVKAARAAVANTPQATGAAAGGNAGSNRPKPNPSMKGTMMGVAPPDMQAEIDKVKAARAAIANAPQATSAAAGGNPGSNRPKPNPSMKGTMMGVAPPDMQAEIDKVKAARQVGAMTSPESPVAKTKPNPAMQGTMMGVAPPDMQAEIDKVRAQVSEEGASHPLKPSGDPASAAPELAGPQANFESASQGQDHLIPSAAEQLGKTQEGVSPFQEGLTPPDMLHEAQPSRRGRLPAEQTTTAASSPQAMAANGSKPPLSASQARPGSDQRELKDSTPQSSMNLVLLLAFILVVAGLAVALLLL